MLEPERPGLARRQILDRVDHATCQRLARERPGSRPRKAVAVTFARRKFRLVRGVSRNGDRFRAYSCGNRQSESGCLVLMSPEVSLVSSVP